MSIIISQTINTVEMKTTNLTPMDVKTAKRPSSADFERSFYLCHCYTNPSYTEVNQQLYKVHVIQELVESVLSHVLKVDHS